VTAHPDRERGVEGMLERAIAVQVRRHRRARGMTVGELAVRAGISKAMLSKIENSLTSSSLTTLARLAAALDVPVTALFRGADVDDREAVFTPADGGARIVARGSRVGHEYVLLGRGDEAGTLVLDWTIPPCYPASSLRKLGGPHKRMEAHLVTLTEGSEVFPLFRHPGTELLFMLEGEMVYGHGEATYTLGPGDALQLDGEGVHGPQELLALPIRFLSVVAYGDAQG
jgi:transcriptional regulator with XRE-family HTH domain/quercetin dioxygenase-like cupin family protein